MHSDKQHLQEEVDYLKNILANASALAGLLKNINQVPEVKLSAHVGSKRSCTASDHSYTALESQSSKRARLVDNNMRKAGVCLHVSENHATLEFCSSCASMSSKASQLP